jgi:hypothetical protein
LLQAFHLDNALSGIGGGGAHDFKPAPSQVVLDPGSPMSGLLTKLSGGDAPPPTGGVMGSPEGPSSSHAEDGMEAPEPPLSPVAPLNLTTVSQGSGRVGRS